MATARNKGTTGQLYYVYIPGFVRASTLARLDVHRVRKALKKRFHSHLV